MHDGAINHRRHFKMGELIRDPIFVSTKDAARLLGLSTSTLEKWRFFRTEDGPPFVRIGRACRYRLEDLKRWSEMR